MKIIENDNTDKTNYSPNMDGIVKFKTPIIRFGHGEVFGLIRFDSKPSKKDKVIEVWKADQKVIALTIFELFDLPQAEGGVYELELRKK